MKVSVGSGPFAPLLPGSLNPVPLDLTQVLGKTLLQSVGRNPKAKTPVLDPALSTERAIIASTSNYRVSAEHVEAAEGQSRSLYSYTSPACASLIPASWDSDAGGNSLAVHGSSQSFTGGSSGLPQVGCLSLRLPSERQSLLRGVRCLCPTDLVPSNPICAHPVSNPTLSNSDDPH